MRARYKQFPPSGVKPIAIQGFDMAMRGDQMPWILAVMGPGLAVWGVSPKK